MSIHDAATGDFSEVNNVIVNKMLAAQQVKHRISFLYGANDQPWNNCDGIRDLTSRSHEPAALAIFRSAF